MRIFVINLEISKDRRASIAAQLDPLPIAYSFLDAIDERRGYDFFTAYDEKKHLANTGRTASATEVGCFASHRCLWSHCVSLQQPIVIMEDDAELEGNFAAALKEAEKLIHRYGFIRLQSHGPARHVRKTQVEEAGQFKLHYCARFPFGAMAYAISPEVAAAFVDKSRVLAGPVDVFIKKFWEHGQPLFALSPSCVKGSALCASSTIKHRKKSTTGGRLRAARILMKLKGLIRRARFNRSHGRRADMRRGGVLARAARGADRSPQHEQETRNESQGPPPARRRWL
jgi:glycosyl transferase family 25